MQENQASERRERRGAILPASLAPRGLSREQSAAYVGVSPSTFDKLIDDGLMPGPKKLRGRLVWDRRRIDECFDALNDEGDNPWDS